MTYAELLNPGISVDDISIGIFHVDNNNDNIAFFFFSSVLQFISLHILFHTFSVNTKLGLRSIGILG